MYNKETLLKSINKYEDRLAVAKILDKGEFAARTKRLAHTEFLDPHQAGMAEKALASFNICEYSFTGGYPGAERTVVIFLPDCIDEEEEEQFTEGLFKVIKITPNSRGSLTHRDYLGSLMGLGIRREVTGDIIVSDEYCNIIVLSEIADYIAGNLSKVGNTGVSTEIMDIIDLIIPGKKTTEIKTTVAALRLDSFCAPAFGISRSKAAEFIKSGKVNLNWEPVLNPDKAVKEGDTISLKGKGRAVLEKIGGKTRKDRITINIMKFV